MAVIKRTTAPFDLSKARAGAGICMLGGDAGFQRVLEFTDQRAVGFVGGFTGVGELDHKKYRFYKDGSCADDGNDLAKPHQLYMLIEEQPSTEGTDASRATIPEDGGENAEPVNETMTISSLQPRERIATEIMSSLLKGIDQPMLLEEAVINSLSDLSFRIAQSMLNKAADKRKEIKDEEPEDEEDGSDTPTEGEEPEEGEDEKKKELDLIEVDKRGIFADAERLAYNTNTILKAMLEKETLLRNPVDEEGNTQPLHTSVSNPLTEEGKPLPLLINGGWTWWDPLPVVMTGAIETAPTAIVINAIKNILNRLHALDNQNYTFTP